MKEKKRTVGQQYLDNINNSPGTDNAVDLSGKLLSDLPDNLMAAVKDGIASYGKTNFYIVAYCRFNAFMDQLLDTKIVVRKSCPTPVCEMSVYRYDGFTKKIEFLWALPDLKSCYAFVANKDKVTVAEYGTLQSILDYFDGTLLKLAKTLNGEKL